VNSKAVVEPVIVQPDPAWVRRFCWIATVIGLLLAAGVWTLEIYLRMLAASADPADRERLRVLLTVAIWSLPWATVLPAGWMLWQARAILKTDRFPLPGQRVLQPTPLRCGRPARRLAYGLAAAGVLILMTIPLQIRLLLELTGWLATPY
jgi:hypothetical protein